jgi:hypothetical protein
MQIKTRTPLLQFQNTPPKLRDSLSGAVFVDDDLWVASDETTSVERLSTDDGLTFQNHKSFSLNGLIDLPAERTDFDQEIDIEGMDFQDSHLWLIGSHSLKRKKVESADAGSDGKLIKKLGVVENDGNRFLLARIPLTKNSQTGERQLVSTAEDPPGSNKIMNAARLPGDTKSNALSDAIRKAEDGKGDIHLARFLDIPGKDNGLDVEGLAVSGKRLFVGLRGPVLRGWAVLLELSVNTSDGSQLVLENVGTDRPYRKHFLDLGGLGVRELCFHGSDLLVLAAPTMTLDGPTRLYRWKDALNASNESLVRADKLLVELEVQSGTGTDRAEGVAIVPHAEPPSQVLILYDSPGKKRKEIADAVTADVFDLPQH